MVKVPKAGRVKSRLGRDIGMTAAAWWYRHQLRRLLRRLRDPRWRLVLSVAPDAEGPASRAFPPDLARIPQGGGHLGRRMTRALHAADGPAILIGSDIPRVARQDIAQAFRVLGTAASVIGPAEDGGFWLIGLRHPNRTTRTFLDGIRWSHPATLTETLPRLPQPVACAATLRDVDTAADLKRDLNTPSTRKFAGG